jgi:hypothetical protein
MSKKMPGMTMVCSLRSSSKNVYKTIGIKDNELFVMVSWTYKSIIQRRRELLQVEPDVECTSRGDIYIKAQLMQALENMITFHLEVLLQGNLGYHN